MKYMYMTEKEQELPYYQFPKLIGEDYPGRIGGPMRMDMYIQYSR